MAEPAPKRAERHPGDAAEPGRAGLLRRLHREDEGVLITEYGLLLGFIVLPLGWFIFQSVFTIQEYFYRTVVVISLPFP